MVHPIMPSGVVWYIILLGNKICTVLNAVCTNLENDRAERTISIRHCSTTRSLSGGLNA